MRSFRTGAANSHACTTSADKSAASRRPTTLDPRPRAFDPCIETTSATEPSIRVYSRAFAAPNKRSGTRQQASTPGPATPEAPRSYLRSFRTEATNSHACTTPADKSAASRRPTTIHPPPQALNPGVRTTSATKPNIRVYSRAFADRFFKRQPPRTKHPGKKNAAPEGSVSHGGRQERFRALRARRSGHRPRWPRHRPARRRLRRARLRLLQPWHRLRCSR